MRAMINLQEKSPEARRFRAGDVRVRGRGQTPALRLRENNDLDRAHSLRRANVGRNQGRERRHVKYLNENAL
jgi:hypothetical protein